MYVRKSPEDRTRRRHTRGGLWRNRSTAAHLTGLAVDYALESGLEPADTFAIRASKSAHSVDEDVIRRLGECNAEVVHLDI